MTDFAYGVIDPIASMAKIALNHNIGMHIDCCLGGYVIPFIQRNNPDDIPLPFDFRTPGVTSISVDTHKYACGPKGCSVLMMRPKQLHGYLGYHSFTTSLYSSPTVSGERSGALIAATWAIIFRLGEEGYRMYAKSITEETRKAASELKKIPEIQLIGPNHFNILAMRCKTFNSLAVASVLEKENGWYLSKLLLPNAFHLVVTPANHVNVKNLA